MTKVRKSREQKIKASLRQHNYHIEVPLATYKASPVAQQAASTPQTIAIDHYPYLEKDIAKTLTLTLTILAIQVITFFLLRNHNLPFLGIHY